MIHLKPTPTMKFLCSYGGKILPRFPDGILRYHGGHTRVLSVNRSISFAELMMKLGEMCGAKVSLRCQLPTEDLDALVSITSDEDLLNLIEEYDRAASLNLKIRAFLAPSKSTKVVAIPPVSTAIASSSSSNSSLSSISSGGSVSKTLIPGMMLPPLPRPITNRNQISPFPISLEKSGRAEKNPSRQYYHQCCTSNSGHATHVYLVNNRNY